MEISNLSLANGQVVPIDKPADWTSFDVVNKLRYASGIRKVGHAGTLDPFATGLLLICFGKATKSVQSLVDLPKEYVARFQFGIETDSHDLTGKIKEQIDDVRPARAALDRALAPYLGEIDQIPPMFSAIKVGGKRLYKMARAGKSIVREPRRVTIHEIEVLEFDKDSCILRIACSKGTYIRSLARDIGRDLHCGAYISELRRTKIGDYHVDSALKIEDFIAALKETNPSNECLPQD